ncbi:MAG: cyclic nucleotide-binding protein, partial [Chloroflexi bacterium]|nr:cyclic nucleotide-binding protein [Chloroflexota bacterium]
MGVYDRLAENIRDKVAVAVATVIAGPAELGHKMLIYLDGSTVGAIGDDALTGRIVADGVVALKYERAETRAYPLPSADPSGQELRVFFEPNVPPPSLIIVGAGHTSIPLAAMGQIAGFAVTLIDARAAFASNERFKDVDEIIVDWPHKVLASRP